MKATVRVLAAAAMAAAWVAGAAWGATWTDGDGVTWTYDAEEGAVLGASPATGALTVPGTIGVCEIFEIADEAFKGCTGLTSLTLPNTLEKIGSDAFLGSGLTELRVPAGWEAFGMMLDGTGVPAGCTVWYGSKPVTWEDEGGGGGGGGEGGARRARARARRRMGRGRTGTG